MQGYRKGREDKFDIKSKYMYSTKKCYFDRFDSSEKS